jgi:phospholipid/cholesterol/gamma-HCH transport system substrate-binding protein
MDKELSNNVRLGIFVIAGILALVMGLYLIGANNSMFVSNIVIRARFKSVDGLTVGNNVRFSGIHTGTIKQVVIINDTTIDVYMFIKSAMQPYIHKNSIAKINSDGLMGNKMIDISPNPEPAPPVSENDMIISKEDFNAGTMLATLSQTNENAATISNELVATIRRINNSKALWNLLEDTAVSSGIKGSLKNLHKASEEAQSAVADIKDLTAGIKKGEGIAGTLLADKNANDNLKSVLKNANIAAENTQKLVARLDSISGDLHHQLVHGKGAVGTLLEDSVAANRLKTSLANLEQGSAAFKQDMEALKQNRFLKKYLKKDQLQKKSN